MKEIILILMICILFLVAGCSEQYTEEDLESIYQQCSDSGKFPFRYLNQKEDMNFSMALDLCRELNLDALEELDCIQKNRNYTVWVEAVGCFEVGEGIFIYGNCDYVRNYWIEKEDYILLRVAKCK